MSKNSGFPGFPQCFGFVWTHLGHADKKPLLWAGARKTWSVYLFVVGLQNKHTCKYDCFIIYMIYYVYYIYMILAISSYLITLKMSYIINALMAGTSIKFIGSGWNFDSRKPGPFLDVKLGAPTYRLDRPPMICEYVHCITWDGITYRT